MITDIQQIGIGVPNIGEAWKWYRENFGMDIPIVDTPITPEIIQKYTDNKAHDFHNVVALNMQGGGGFDIWQYMSRKPEIAKFQVKLGDLGIFAVKIKSNTLKSSYLKFRLNQKDLVSYNTQKSPDNKEHFFAKDPYNSYFQVIENDSVFRETRDFTGGSYGVIIGVSDIEKSLEFYKKVLGYDKVIYEREGVFRDFSSLPGGENKFKRVLLTHSKKKEGALSNIFGDSQIELIQVLDREPNKIYENRLWGDIGFFDISFAVRNMSELKMHCEEHKIQFTIDSLPEIHKNPEIHLTMPELVEHFAFIEDPDGNLIRFIETYKLAISENLNWNIDIKKRNSDKPISKWKLRVLAWNRFEEE